MNTSITIINTVIENLGKLRAQKPLLHHLTNHVVMNDCANITLHIGGAPVMTMDPAEAGETAAAADALILNIGTLTAELVDSMITAGKKANQKGIPVLLDPVGAGATSLRTKACRRILKEVKTDIIKGNAGEVSILAGVEAVVRGVDSAETTLAPPEVAGMLAAQEQGVVVITGETDYVADGQHYITVKNGHHMLGRLTGTGCMLGSVMGAFAAVADNALDAAIAALLCYGVAAELAGEKTTGPASFKNALFDEVYALDQTAIRARARVEISD